MYELLYLLFQVDMEVGKRKIDLMTSLLIFIFAFKNDIGFAFQNVCVLVEIDTWGSCFEISLFIVEIDQLVPKTLKTNSMFLGHTISSVSAQLVLKYHQLN